MPNSVDLSYFGPVFVSYPVDLSYPTFWLEPNTGAAAGRVVHKFGGLAVSMYVLLRYCVEKYFSAQASHTSCEPLIYPK